MHRELNYLRCTAALVGLMLLVACDNRSSQPDAPADPVATRSDAALIARLTALPPGQLDIVLFRAIRDARQECQGIAASRRIDDQNGRPAWSAQCDRGGKYLLVLNPDGQMTVTAGAAFGQP